MIYCKLHTKCNEFQVDGWNLCNIAKAILARGLDNTKELNKLNDEDKLKILQKIGSTEMNCLDSNRKVRNNAIRVANKQVLDYVSKECDCLDQQYVSDY